jgi:hypothetical protein
MLKTFCHDQVKLLLERMDSNPEEFLHHHKWNPFLPNMHHVSKGTVDYFEAFTLIERNLVARKFDAMCRKQMREHAYNRILEVAIAGEDKGRVGERMRVDSTGGVTYSPASNTASSGGFTLNTASNTASAITIGNTTLTEKDLKKMKKKTIWSVLF